MKEIKIGSHVGMAGKEMFLASVKEAEDVYKRQDTLHGKYYKEIPLGTIKDRYLISVCTQEDRTRDFVCKMLD